MKIRLGAAVLFVAMVTAYLAVNLTSAQPGTAGGNLLACPWFREEIYPYGVFPSLCNDWTRDNNIGILQANGIPSPDSMDGTAYRITRDYNHGDESKLWQIVESPGGLLLHFSVFHQVPSHGDLTVRVYGRDTRYGIGGWALLWTPVDLQTGDNVWRYTEKELTLERPYNFYMVEIMGHVPLPIGTTGAAVTGVYFAVEGSAIYLPVVAK